MKRIVFIFSLLTVVNYSQAQIGESVIVEYEVVHYGVKHKQVLYIDDFGKKKVIDVYNPDNTTKRYLSLNGMDYTFLLENKNLNYKYKSKENDMIYHVYDMKTLPDHEYYVKVDKTGTEKIAGKECEVFKIITADKKETIYYIWNGILLKMTSKTSKLIAVKIIENPVFKKGQFKIPEDYEFK